ncbi:hypothetical protein ES332_D12G112000v1 [Gossypium tomentosum]|uniref:Uncharacterized protein n=1 Tax=Gossypium tomentosum TaxID=34277 RepID=A0A5D2I801_GOSTO|nr:hypothetical protein ES332_D12G112000v1 [Gossypium tomentosum]
MAAVSCLTIFDFSYQKLHSIVEYLEVVVEYMAAGAIPIAHNSAGPKMDIVLDEDGQQTGFLAQNVEEYADAVLKIPQSDQLYAVLPSYRIALEDHTNIENNSYTCSCLLGFFTLSIQSLEKA